VGTAVTLTFMGVTYWLVPHLAGRALWSRGLALAQVWSWFVGMIIFSNAMHRLGLLGAPRRTMLGAAAYIQPEWKPLLALVGIGGAILFASSILYFLNLVLTCLASRAPAPAVPEFAEPLSGPDHAPAILDRWRPWLVLAGALIVIAYGPTLFRLAISTPLVTPGFRVW
jgi:cytochrome c oxidase subunit 1